MTLTAEIPALFRLAIGLSVGATLLTMLRIYDLALRIDRAVRIAALAFAVMCGFAWRAWIR